MILPKEKLIYVHVPKTGGVSIEEYLLDYFNYSRSIFNFTDGLGYLNFNTANNGFRTQYPCMHYPLKDILKQAKDYNVDNNWTIFSVVRNPYYKLISELFFHPINSLSNHYHTISNNAKIRLINDSIDQYFNDLDILKNYHSLHSYPQYKFFEDVNVNYQIFKFEDGLYNAIDKLGFGGNEFPHKMNMFQERRIPRPKYSNIITSYLVEIVNEKYQKDFEIFEYEMLEPRDFPN